MPLKISVNSKLHPKGAVIAIPRVGAVPNGGSIVVPDDTVTRSGKPLADAFKGHKSITVTKTGQEKEGGDVSA